MAGGKASCPDSFHEGLCADFPVDMLVRGEAEVERRERERDLFMTQITREGRVMYEVVHA